MGGHRKLDDGWVGGHLGWVAIAKTYFTIVAPKTGTSIRHRRQPDVKLL